MPSRFIPSAGTVKPACSRAAEQSKKVANSYATELSGAAILTKREAAEYLRTSTRFVERMVQRGRLRAFKPTSGIFRVRRSDLDEFLNRACTIEGDGQ